MRNRVWGILIAFLLLFNSGIMTYGDETDTDTDSNTDYDYYSPGIDIDPQPSLKMSSDGIVDMASGEERDVEIKLKNVSSFYAYNILVQANAGSNEVPFTMQFLDKSNIKYYLQNTATMTVKVRIKVDDDAVAGTYPITLNYSCTAKNKTGFTGSDTLYLKITNKQSVPTVTMSDFKISNDKVSAGSNFTVTADISTIEVPAKDVTVMIDGLTATGIGMQNGSSTAVLGQMQKNEKNQLEFKMNAHKEMVTGSYPITFKLSYKDSAGKDYTKDYGYFINVIGKDDTGSDEKADLTVTMAEPNGTFGVGQNFTVGMKVKNTSGREARNITVSTISDEKGEIVPRSTSVGQIKSLKSGEERTLSFQFSATSESKSKNYAIGFEIEYETGTVKDGVYDTKSFKQYAGVNVYNPDEKKDDESEEDKKTSKPKIIISKYVSDPIMVEAGEKFDLTMTFKNTHPVKSVENVKLYITVDETTEEKGNVFTPDNASNTFYIDKIAPKGEVSHTFKMYTVPDAQARTYTIVVNFEYEDSEYNEYETKELVGINVRQPAELSTSDIVIPTDGFMGEPVNVMFELYNTGKVKLSNLMIKVEGDNFDTSQSSTYIGDFEAGSSDYYEGIFYPNTVGESQGKLIISYENDTGESVEKVTDFTINVSEMDYGMMESEFPEDEVIEEEGMPAWIKIAIGVGIGIAVVAVLIVIIRKIVIKRRERELDE